MSDPSLIEQQRLLFRALIGLADERHRLEPELRDGYRSELANANADHDEQCRKLERRRAKRLDELEQEQRERRAAAEARYLSETTRAAKQHARGKFELTSQLDADAEAAKSSYQESIWAAEAFLEGARADSEKRLREQNEQIAAQMAELASLRKRALDVFELYELPVPSADAPDPSTCPRSLDDSIQQTDKLVAELESLQILRHLNGRRLFSLVFLVGLVLIYPLGWLLTRFMPREPGLPLLLGLGGAVAVFLSMAAGFLFLALIRQRARREAGRILLPVLHYTLNAETLRANAVEHVRRAHIHFLDITQQRYAEEQATAQRRHLASQSDLAQRRMQGLAALDQRLQSENQASEERRTSERKRADRHFENGKQQIEARYQERRKEVESAYQTQRDAITARFLEQWHDLVARWQPTLQQAQAAAASLRRDCDTRFPLWNDPSWAGWQPSTSPHAPPYYRFGSYRLPAHSIVSEPPWSDSRPSPDAAIVSVPAVCPLAEPFSLLFHAQEEGRDVANEAMRAILFRMLTGMPPGRVRFLIVDPVGLGQNFGAFMHLADHDEKLVSSRIWTETAHIEQRLADLTGHMENVIQKYLRNRYPSIADYNSQAGEVAEPYRVLVIANFPVNFSVEAIRRLVSIAQSGPRCGVSLLMSIDRKQPLPKGCELADLERHGINLDWTDDRFCWRDPDFASHLLTLDPAPPEELGNRLLQQIGERARAAQRVQVPFDFIVPAPDQWWTHDSRQGIRVPLGRAGATRRQCLELGKGTSQHVLIAGKTGSGKSTLLHALIVNLSLLYSPDEIELYLVDFKKGVEFKTYTLHDLPHARVVAIESEREFGLSVLQRLDVEITARGEAFRTVNVQDVNAYREALPDARMPRILLIVDEFQEFFVEDDRIAQEASRLLDRLVRQGRAFGIHVLLGSQTIGGAYSLARSTIDQMAVRIALQCSEADAHLILSDDNSAARLLSRPGEAIYNDANGRVEGNDPFQVVWLGEDQREQYLDQLRRLSEQRPPLRRSPMVVFEGNAVADPGKNSLLRRLLTAPSNPDLAGAEPRELAWLGEAMAIDELTAAAFRRQNGSNLVVVGQQNDSALGILATAIISLAGYSTPSNGTTSALPRFTIIDGLQSESPRTGLFVKLAEILPEPIRLVGTRELPLVLADLAAELERRQATPNDEASSLYLVLHGIQRMRDVRRQEDDFSMFGKPEAGPPTPDRLLANLIREGPALGIHLLLWCDTLSNLQRVCDRQLLRELTMRVVFQMNVADSGNLIDSPAASKLGLHRALFCSEEEGRLEKFRPYGLPSDDWLAWVRETLRARAASAGTTVPG